ncbi:Flp pilus assembly protein CpaB [Dyella sp. A6]|uniref:Flp pilus assembly protein CpaB n=1 Tax=Dyella aluminiiresistens TaxID=3069105 RepID=UPI002E766160|nr:Flp pilus assembly protein CpaB [Dyella sp. A6]
MQKITRIAALMLVVIAVVLAIVAFGLGRRNARTQAQAHTGNTPVSAAAATDTAGMAHLVTAMQALPAGRPIAASALHLMATAHAPPDSYATVDAVAGDVPLVAIPAGTTITRGLLAHGLAMEIKPGERALAVPVDEASAAGNHIHPGDYVDVFLSLRPAPSFDNHDAEMKRPQTRLLLSHLRVLAYGTQGLPVVAQASHASADKKATAATDRRPPHTAVLAVPVDEVDQLLLGMQDGKLDLALRNPIDTREPDLALFPKTRSVLPTLARLTPAQRHMLGSPENQAYEGIDGLGLAGQAIVRPLIARHDRQRVQRIEIIRGTQAHSL